MNFNIIKNTTLTLGLVLMTLASNASAVTITSKSEIKKDFATFEIEDRGLKQYKQTKAKTKIRTRIKADNFLFGLLVNRTTNKVETRFLGSGFGGHSQLRLLERAGRYYIFFDRKMDHIVEGIPIRFEHQAEFEARFTRGSWDGYLENQYVELELTSQGLREFTQFLKFEVEASFQSTVESLDRQYPGGNPSARITEFKTKNNFVMKGTIDKLKAQFPDGSFQGEITMEIMNAAMAAARH